MKDQGFACHCGPKQQRRIKAIRRWATNFIYDKPKESYPSDFFTNIVIQFTFRYLAHIEFIGFDQWGGIVISSDRVDGLEKWSTYVQGDTLEDALALSLRLWWKKFPNGRKYPSDSN